MAVNTTNIKFNQMYASSASSNNRYCYIYRATSGGTVYSSNLAGSTVFDYFVDSPTNNDAFYVGFKTGANPAVYFQKWRDVEITVGTALNGTPTLVWEYYNGSWTTLTVTNGSAMQSTGVQTITFKPPTDWTTLDPVTGGASNAANAGFFVRCRMSSNTGVTEGGANTTTALRMGSNAFHIVDNVGGTAVTPEDLYDTAVNQSWDCDPDEQTDSQGGNKQYYFNCHIEIGQPTFLSGGTKSGYLDFNNQSIILENDCRLGSTNTSCVITAGTNTQDETGRYTATVSTNQRNYSRCFISLSGKVNLYGFEWENKYQGNAVGTNYNNVWELSSVGYANASADGSAIIDTVFTGFRYLHLAVSTNDGVIRNTKIIHVAGAGIITGATLEKISILSSSAGARNITTQNPVFYDFVLKDVTYKFSTFNMSGTIRARNFTGLSDLSTSNACTWASTNTGDIREQYSVDVMVVEQDGTPISGASVILTPNGSNEYENNFSTTTDANGVITTQYVTRKRITPSTTGASTNTSVITVYDDFTLTINATGYQETATVFELDSAKSLIISLLPEVSSGGVGGLNLAEDLIRI